jgi:3-isopropylmalate dehydrogenase
MILSTAMMLRHSFGLEREAQAIEKAVNDCLTGGHTTGDLGGALDTDGAADAVIAAIR